MMRLKHKLAILFFAISFLPSLAISIVIYHNYSDVFYRNSMSSLEYIANYKSNEARLYFTRIVDDIKSMQSSWCIRENLPLIIGYFNDQSNPKYILAKKILDDRFKPTQKTWGLLDIMLLDTKGTVVYATNEKHVHIGHQSTDPGQRSFKEGLKDVYITDVFLDMADDEKPKIFVSAPDYNYEGSLLGVIIFEVDLDSVYKIIQDYTGLGATGETLIAVKSGNDALYLNPLRHDQDTALKRRIAMGDRIGIPIQRAVQGETGSGYTLDYRGCNVMAAWRHIPLLRWGLVTKIDAKEALKNLSLLKDLLIVVMCALFILCWLASYMIARTLSVYKDHLDDLVRERTSEISSLNRNIEFIIGATKTGLDIIDSDYNMVYIDPEWQKIYGNYKGKKCYEYFMDRKSACPECGVRKALETKRPVIQEEILIKENNRPIQVTTIPYQDANGNWLVAEVNVDITERKKSENAVRISEEKIRNITNALPAVVYTYQMTSDGKQKFLFISDMVKTIFELSKEEALTDFDKLWGLILPEERDGLYESIKNAYAKHSFWQYDYRIKTPSGKIKWIHGESIPEEKRSDGSVVWNGTLSDITLRKNMEGELIKYRAHLEDLVNEQTKAIRQTRDLLELQIKRVPLGHIMWDKDFKVVSWNPAAEQIFGYSQAEAVGKHPYDIIVPPSAQKQVNKIWDELLNGSENSFSVNENVTKDGRIIVCQWTNTPLKKESGEVIGVLSMTQDVTEHKLLEDKLKRAAEDWQTTFDSSSDMIMLLDKEMTVIRANRSTLEFLDSPIEDVVGKKCYRLFHGTDSQIPMCPTANTVNTKRRESAELFLSNKGIWAIVSADPVLDKDGNLIAIVHTVRDISERKRVEEKIRQKDMLIQNLNNNIKSGMVYQVLRLKDGTRKFTYLSDSVKELYGCTAEEGMNDANCVYGKILDEDRGRLIEAEEEANRTLSVFRAEARVLLPSGDIRWASFVSTPRRIDDGATCWDGIEFDITERKRAAAALEISEANYRSIFELASDAIMIRDIESYVIVDANEQACELLCYPKPELLATNPEALFPDEAPNNWKYIKPIFDKASAGEPQYIEVLFKDKAGRTFWAESHIKRAIIGNSYRLLSIVHDISERKESEQKIIELNNSIARANEELKELALIDSHTGLYNYRYYSGVIEAEFARAQRQDSRLSLIMMDIDYFKSINDVYGHQFGDLILKQFSELLKKTVRLYDTVIRFGGEEFIIIAPGTGSKEALALAKRILTAVDSFGFGNKEHSVKLKISAACGSYPDDPRIKSSADFINIADIILSKAKEEGGNRAYSSSDYGQTEDKEFRKQEPDVSSLKDKITKLTTRGNQSVAEAIFAFAKTIELKDSYTGAHVDDTMHYAISIAEKLGLSAHEVEIVKYAAALHDLGKVGIPEAILHKTEELTEDEFNIIKRHPQIGADIIRPIHFLHDIIPAMLHHHEHWDGTGYPGGLKGGMIPLGARIVAVADAYQAMTSDRPYRKALGQDKAIEALKENSGTQFDPNVVKAFLAVIKREKTSKKYRKK